MGCVNSRGNAEADSSTIRTTTCIADPVLAADGMTYDRESITQWFTNKTTSPSTGSDLPHTRLLPNRSVKCLIDVWQATNGTCWSNTPDKQTAPVDVDTQYSSVSSPELSAASSATAPISHDGQEDVSAATASTSAQAPAQAQATSRAPIEPTAATSPVSASSSASDVTAVSESAPVAAAGGGGSHAHPAAAPAPSPSQNREHVPDDAVVVVRQEVSDSGIHLRCEEIRPQGDESKAYVRWMVHNKHPSYKAASVTITWKSEGQYEAYNYTLPEEPITRRVPPGEEVMVYTSDKILPDFVFGGIGAEWLYTWQLARR